MSGRTQGAAGESIPEDPAGSDNRSAAEEASSFSLGIVGPSGTAIFHGLRMGNCTHPCGMLNQALSLPLIEKLSWRSTHCDAFKMPWLLRAERVLDDGDLDGRDAALYAADRAQKQGSSEDAVLDALEAAETRYNASHQMGEESRSQVSKTMSPMQTSIALPQAGAALWRCINVFPDSP